MVVDRHRANQVAQELGFVLSVIGILVGVLTGYWLFSLVILPSLAFFGYYLFIA